MTPSSTGGRLVVAGVGSWGGSWIQVVRESPHWELAALVDNDEGALARAAADAGFPEALCFTSLSAALAVQPDAVVIVVPPSAHLLLALEAFDLGLHCLIEKPLAVTVEDGRRIAERADASGRIAMVSQQYRHRPGARTVQRLIGEGAVGRIGAVSICFCQDPPTAGFQLVMDEPLLVDMAIHHFDLIRGVLGFEPATVLARSYNPSWSRLRGNAAATVVLGTADGATTTYTGSWAPRGRITGWDGVWEIHGEDGSIHWSGDRVLLRSLQPPLSAKLMRRALGREWRGRQIAAARVREADRHGSLAEFRAAIREQREPETSACDNLRSLALTLAAVESARRGEAVDVGELLR